LRDAWIRKLGQWTAEQLVFIDETGVNTACSFRTRGWGRKGQRVRTTMAVGRRVNHSVLPALTIDGYIACNVYEGGVNQRTFDAFIRDDLLPKCNAFPGPKSVIIMNNATIHKSDVILISIPTKLTLEIERTNRTKWL